MSRFRDRVVLAMILATAMTVTGCLGTVETQVIEPLGEAAEIAEAMTALSAEDRAIAERQRICPVGGEALGSMGPPVKVDLDGKSVFVCCTGCTSALKDDPAKYLAKLEQVDSQQ